MPSPVLLWPPLLSGQPCPRPGSCRKLPPPVRPFQCPGRQMLLSSPNLFPEQRWRRRHLDRLLPPSQFQPTYRGRRLRFRARSLPYEQSFQCSACSGFGRPTCDHGKCRGRHRHLPSLRRARSVPSASRSLPTGQIFSTPVQCEWWSPGLPCPNSLPRTTSPVQSSAFPTGLPANSLSSLQPACRIG